MSEEEIIAVADNLMVNVTAEISCSGIHGTDMLAGKNEDCGLDYRRNIFLLLPSSLC